MSGVGSARVVVVDVDPSDVLRDAVKVLYDGFKREGLVPDHMDEMEVKYHVTLVNTKYSTEK